MRVRGVLTSEVSFPRFGGFGSQRTRSTGRSTIGRGRFLFDLWDLQICGESVLGFGYKQACAIPVETCQSITRVGQSNTEPTLGLWI
jgi:hypothetical protein